MQATHSSDEDYHSPDEKDDVWVHHKDIGVGGFGIVKLFVNQVRWWLESQGSREGDKGELFANRTPFST